MMFVFFHIILNKEINHFGHMTIPPKDTIYLRFPHIYRKGLSSNNLLMGRSVCYFGRGASWCPPVVGGWWFQLL